MMTKSLADSGFPEYDITETGVVIHRKTGKHLLPYSSGQVTIKTDIGGFKSMSVARLVAEAFVPNPAGLPYVVPMDGNRWNIRAENLVWSSKKFRSPSRRSADVPYSFAAALGKRTQIIDLHLKRVHPKEIAIKLGLAATAVTKIVREFDIDCIIVTEQATTDELSKFS